MKLFSILFLTAFIGICSWSQGDNVDPVKDLAIEITKLKEAIKQMQENELQTDRSKYQKNYQLIVNGIEIIKEMHQGTLEITGARSQNILYKKLIDINNPSSDALGFQLIDVMDKILEENINLLPLVDKEKKRLRGQVSNLFDGLKKTFPPLQIMSSAFSLISGFSSYMPKIEKLGRKTDSLIVDVTNPISKEIIQKINTQLQPYIIFYTELNRTNSAFETALYQHEIQYRDFIEELTALKDNMDKKLNLNESIGGQINDIFDLANSSSIDFNYKQKLENETVKDLVGTCINVFDLVDRYKKFTNDFIIIQDDFYRNNLLILDKIAKNLPYKDIAKIDQLIADLNLLKNGSPVDSRGGFDASYKQRLKSIVAKLYSINKLRM